MVLLQRAAAALDAGDDPSAWRAHLVEHTTGPERRAVRFALRNLGAAELTGAACRSAAAELRKRAP